MTSTQGNQKLDSVFTLLKLTYGIVPIIAGLDKFTNLLTDWTKYLTPGMLNLLPFSSKSFMAIVGIIEIIAGLIVLVKTNLGAYIVSAWLVVISISLIISMNYLDIAVRDLVMAIGAFSLARISSIK